MHVNADVCAPATSFWPILFLQFSQHEDTLRDEVQPSSNMKDRAQQPGPLR